MSNKILKNIKVFAWCWKTTKQKSELNVLLLLINGFIKKYPDIIVKFQWKHNIILNNKTSFNKVLNV